MTEWKPIETAPKETGEELRKQVALQCKAVVHMATAISQVYADYETMFSEGSADALIDRLGRRTAKIMETLGNMLNAIDAITDDDEWLNPVFEESRRLWPGPPK